MCDHDKLLKRISELESLNDQLQTELRYLDKLLKRAGFEEGVQTMKATIEELLQEDR